METIWKYKLDIKHVNHIDVPEFGKVLCVQVQGGVPCVWIKVNPANPLVKREFNVYFTGEECDCLDGEYIDTFQINELVFHVYGESQKPLDKP